MQNKTALKFVGVLFINVVFNLKIFESFAESNCYMQSADTKQTFYNHISEKDEKWNVRNAFTSGNDVGKGSFGITRSVEYKQASFCGLKGEVRRAVKRINLKNDLSDEPSILRELSVLKELSQFEHFPKFYGCATRGVKSKPNPSNK